MCLCNICSGINYSQLGASMTTTDEAAIAAVFRRLEQTWAHADATGFGELFTADCTYTTWFGTAYQGREEVVESHRVLWSRFLKGSRLVGEDVSVRFLTPDVAVVTGRGDVYTGRPPRRLSKVQTYTLVREADGRWRIAAFQNTKRRPLLEAISFQTEPRLIPAARKR
jgi:uncharacterized protein (TIGR02246 family)